MLFLIETILDLVIAGILFLIGLRVGDASVGLGIAMMAVGAMTISPKKLVSLNSSYSEAQPWWNVVLSIALGALILAGGFGIATIGGSGLKKAVGDTLGGALIRRAAFVFPRKAYKARWEIGFGGIRGDGKKDAIVLERAMLSPDASVAVIAYSVDGSSGSDNWLMVIDAKTGEPIAPMSVYATLDAYATLLGEGGGMRRWTYDGSAPRSISSFKKSAWTHGQPEPRDNDGPEAFAGLSGTGLRVYAAFDGQSAKPNIVKEADGLYSRSVKDGILLFDARGRKDTIAIDSLSEALAWWDASPDGATLAYSLAPLDKYSEFMTGKEADIYFWSASDPGATRSLVLLGRQADWLDFSDDGKIVYTFDARLRVMSAIDAASGDEVDRAVLYGKGLVDPAGISAHGEALLVVDRRKPSVSLYSR